MAPEAREDLTDNAPELSNLPLAGSSTKLLLEAEASQDSRAEAQALAREISGNGRVPKHHCETLASLLAACCNYTARTSATPARTVRAATCSTGPLLNSQATPVSSTSSLTV